MIKIRVTSLGSILEAGKPLTEMSEQSNQCDITSGEFCKKSEPSLSCLPLSSASTEGGRVDYLSGARRVASRGCYDDRV